MNVFDLCSGISSACLNINFGMVIYGCFSGDILFRSLKKQYLIKSPTNLKFSVRMLQKNSSYSKGSYLSGSNSIIVFNNGYETNITEYVETKVKCFQLSPSTKSVCYGLSNGKIFIYDIVSESTRFLDQIEGKINSIEFSSNETKLVSVSSKGKVVLWNLESWQKIMEYQSDLGNIKTISFLQSIESLIYGSENGFIEILNYKDKKIINRFHGSDDAIRQIITCSNDTIMIWLTSENALYGYNLQTSIFISKVYTEEFRKKNYWSQGILDLELSKSGHKVFTLQNNGSVYEWNVTERNIKFNKCITTPLKHSSVKMIPNVLSFVPVSENKKISIWNYETSRRILALRTKEIVRSVAIDKSRAIFYYGSKSGNVRAFSIFDPKNEILKFSHPKSVVKIKLDPSGMYLGSALSNGSLHLWNLCKSSLIETNFQHLDAIRDFDFGHNCKNLATSSMDRKIKIWNVGDMELTHELVGHTSPVLTIIFGSIKDVLVSGAGDNTIRLWKLHEKGEYISKVFKGHSAPVLDIYLDVYNKQIITGSYDKTARIWSLSDNRERDIILMHKSPILSVSAIPTKNWIITGSENGEISIFNGKDGSRVKEIKTNEPVRDIQSL